MFDKIKMALFSWFCYFIFFFRCKISIFSRKINLISNWIELCDGGGDPFVNLNGEIKLPQVELIYCYYCFVRFGGCYTIYLKIINWINNCLYYTTIYNFENMFSITFNIFWQFAELVIPILLFSTYWGYSADIEDIYIALEEEII